MPREADRVMTIVKQSMTMTSTASSPWIHGPKFEAFESDASSQLALGDEVALHA